MNRARQIVHVLLATLAIGLAGGCDSKERGATFSSEVTEEERRELEARNATFEASVAAARAAREAARRARDRDAKGDARQAIHIILALPEANSGTRAGLHHSLQERLDQEQDISYEMLDAGGDPDLQLRQLHQMAATPPDVLLVTAVAANEIGLAVETLTDLGTRVIAVEHALTDCEPAVTLHLDNHAIGRAVGEFTIDALRRKQEEQELPTLSGRVVVIRGDETGDTGHLRQAGFTEALLAHPDVRLVHDAPGFWDPGQTAERFREAVRLQKDFDVVFAHSDGMARTARAAAQEFEMQQRLLFIGIGGARGREGGLDAVQRGILGATVQLPDPTADILEITLKLARDPSWRPAPAKRELPWTLITGSNLPTDIGTGPLLPPPPLIAPTSESEDEP